MATKRPDWFDGFWEEAIQMSSRSDEFMESALGIAALIDEGKMDEARKLYEQARKHMAALRLIPAAPGEKGSTQLKRMLTSPKYPEKLRLEISRRVKV